MQENFVFRRWNEALFRGELCPRRASTHMCVIEMFFLLLPFREPKLLIANVIRLLG